MIGTSRVNAMLVGNYFPELKIQVNLFIHFCRVGNKSLFTTFRCILISFSLSQVSHSVVLKLVGAEADAQRERIRERKK